MVTDGEDTTGVLESTTTRMSPEELEEDRTRSEEPMPPRGDDLQRGSTQPTKLTNRNKKKKKIKAGSRARHRLRSIFRDVKAMEDLCCQSHKNSDSRNALSSDNNTPLDNLLVHHALQHWKVVANERCGSWYAAPSCSSCYFKSTDGHVNTWNFSLKRLNLPLLEHVIQADGGCLVVDSSVRKVLPDSFSKTIPLWATVLNNIVLRYASDDADDDGISRKQQRQSSWDTNLYTPRGVVSREEHLQIANLIEDRVESLFRSGAIVDPLGLIKTLTKPLRVVWMNHEGKIFPSNDNVNDDDNENHINNAGDGNDSPTETLEELLANYFVIICWNPSSYKLAENPQDDEMIVVQKHQTEWITDSDGNSDDSGGDVSADDDETGKSSSDYFYTPGTADDEESWARHLTPALFWKNQEALLNSKIDDDQVDALIDVLVHQEREAEQAEEDGCFQTENANTVVYSYADKIGETNLWIGSRRAGRPPECWLGFDAILNVTSMEYDDLIDIDNNTNIDPKKDRFYLQLHVEEGKRDRTQLEKWMPVGLAFLIHHLQNNRRVLVHCAQGKDRSVALALVFVVIACPLRFPLKPKLEFTEGSWDLSTLGNHHNDADDYYEEETETQQYMLSGLPKAIVKRLLDTNGKELFLLWVHQQLQDGENNNSEAHRCCLADKEGVRIALHLIRQDREVADPTRSTMQKINRFLMSSAIYR